MDQVHLTYLQPCRGQPVCTRGVPRRGLLVPAGPFCNIKVGAHSKTAHSFRHKACAGLMHVDCNSASVLQGTKAGSGKLHVPQLCRSPPPFDPVQSRGEVHWGMGPPQQSTPATCQRASTGHFAGVARARCSVPVYAAASTAGAASSSSSAPTSAGRTTVVLTREAGKNGKMQKALSKLGYHCIELPLIEHTPGPDK